MTKQPIPTRFKPGEIEKKWQQKWEEAGVYTPDIPAKQDQASPDKNAKKPYYNLMMFPYPSAEGLHVGNMYAFTGVDVHGRFKRMQGFDVFEPIGLDGFGIHSENYAIKVNRTPSEHAKISEKNFYRQLKVTGNGYDWTRTVETYDPDYYRWTQWLFVEMFKHGLAYRAYARVNWCPSCKTVLADEQVIPVRNTSTRLPMTGTVGQANVAGGDGSCERCSSAVEKRDLEQWFFKITEYAERLLQNTYKPTFNWPDKVKIGQRNWIGKKTGITISYQLSVDSLQQIGFFNKKIHIDCFTTTPVNFGATFLVLAPEHPLVTKITTKEHSDTVTKYVQSVKKRTAQERIAKGIEKTGVFTGSYAINHVTNESIPIWVSDFVLMDVGAGAIQGCPGHDIRDFEFAQKFNIPIKRVVVGPDGDTSPIERPEQVIESGSPGEMINSDFLNGMPFKDAMVKTMDYFEKKNWGKRITSYHLRDWLISRQRYWGAPIPMIYCEACAKAGKSWFTVQRDQRVSKSEGQKFSASDSQTARQSDSSDAPMLRYSELSDLSEAMVGWYPVSEKDLPVLLPEVENWRPTGTDRGPLAGVPEFYKTTCPQCGSEAKRETDVCDTFLDSSWYFLRYPFANSENQKTQSISKSKSQNNQTVRHSDYSDNADAADSPTLRQSELSESSKNLPWDKEILKRWTPVDSYIGGAEHTVLHLLYARFVWMALRDWGYIEVNSTQSTVHSQKGKKDTSSYIQDYDPDEPFKRFFAHGLIIKDGAKMSKSKGNVVIPDKYIELYGADTLRTYLMFLGPFEGGGDFKDTGIAGMYKWLSRVWRLCQSQKSTLRLRSGQEVKSQKSDEGLKILHKTIKAVTHDVEELKYNTAIARLMECTNWWMEHQDEVNKEFVEAFIKLLAPFAPHMAEELFQALRKSQISSTKSQTNSNTQSIKFKSIHVQDWPQYDEKLAQEDSINMVVQINGKTREVIAIASQIAHSQTEVEQLVKQSAKTKAALSDKQIIKTVFVPGRLINFVVN